MATSPSRHCDVVRTIVVCVDRDAGRAQDTAAMITAKGGTALACQADVSVEQDCDRMARFAKAEYGRVDILDNNAAIHNQTPLLDLTTTDWDRIMRVNLTGMMMSCRAVIPVMMTNEAGGSVINISSGAVQQPRPGQSAYTTSKGAIVAFTRAIAAEHAAVSALMKFPRSEGKHSGG